MQQDENQKWRSCTQSELSYLWLSLSAALLRVRLLVRVVFIPLEVRGEKNSNDQRGTFITSCTSRQVVGLLQGGRGASHPGSRRRPQWSVSSRGAACVPVWSGAETCPLPPSPPPFCPFLSGKNDKEKVNRVP